MAISAGRSGSLGFSERNGEEHAVRGGDVRSAFDMRLGSPHP